MPTYEDLRSYFEDSSVLQEVASAASRIKIVSGYTLDINPLWALLYDLENDLAVWPLELDGRPRLLSDFIGHYLHGSFPWGSNFIHSYAHWLSRTSYQGYRRRDLYKTVETWNMLAGRYNTRRWSPVNLTIIHRPIEIEAAELDDQEDLRRLVTLAREASAAVRIEERPRARLALSNGDGIQTSKGKSGTLGGVLHDPMMGKSYAVTCAHVAALGDTVKDSGGRLVGTCNAHTPCVILPSVAACDPVNLAIPIPSPGNGPEVNMLDCALIDLSVLVSPSALAGVAKSLSPGQNVILRGASSHTTRHKLGSLCLSYLFTEGGNDYCFRDTIEILPQSWGPFGGPLGQLMTAVPSQGDSGGWVLTDDQPPSWAGLFFGEDGHRGFAIRASWVHDWAATATGSSLIL